MNGGRWHLFCTLSQGWSGVRRDSKAQENWGAGKEQCKGKGLVLESFGEGQGEFVCSENVRDMQIKENSQVMH